MSRKDKGYTRKNYRRNSKKNPWRNTRQKATVKKVDWKKLLGALLVISIPIMCTCLSASILMRAPDTYQYSLRASQAVEGSYYVVDGDKLADTMAEFMSSRDDKLVLLEAVEYEPENVFTQSDQKAMVKLRFWNNILLAAGIGGFIVTLILYFLLVRWRAYDIHRKCFKISIVSFALLLGGSFVIKLVPRVRNAFYVNFLGVKFKEEDFIYLIFGENFPKQIAIFEAIASVVIFLVVSYITWKLIGKRRMFKDREIKRV